MEYKSQHVGGRQVRLNHHAVRIEDEVAVRGEIEELRILRPRLLQLVPGFAQLLVLRLQLDLVDAQLVDDGGGVHLRQVVA